MEEMGWEKQKYLIDGFPRNHENLDFWEKTMKSIIDFRFTLFLECEEQILLKRVLERAKQEGNTKRTDDNEISFLKRMVTFKNQTLPVINYYEASSKLYKVNAGLVPDLVFKQIKYIIENDVKNI